MLDAVQPLSRGRLKSSRALLREIERAAIEVSSAEKDLEAQVAHNSLFEDLDAQAALMRAQVDAFLEQQLHEAKHQAEEVQEAQHLLRGCLLRMKEEPQQMGMVRKKARVLRGARARSTPPKNAVLHEQKKENLDLDTTVCDAWKLVGCGRSEELYHEHVQLKMALKKSQEDAAAAARKSGALQAQIDALLQENAQLSRRVTECQNESSDLMYKAASKEKLLTTHLKEKQDDIEYLQLDKRLLQQSLAQRGDANAVIRCLDALQRDYDKLALQHSHLQEMVAERLPVAKFSAQVVSAEPLVLGIEAEEEAVHHSYEFYASELQDTGCRQAFRVGRVRVPIHAGSVPVCAKIKVENDGDAPWPQTAAAVLVSGDAFGCSLISLGSALPGQCSDLSMDLLVSAKAEPGIATSMWAVVNAATGKPLGPLLVFEVAWTLP